MKIAKNTFHFIGIGGIGMSGLAELMHCLGAHVTGSDLKWGDMTQHLKELGICVYEGHYEAHVGDADVVVYSSAVSKDNPEYQYALRQGIPLIPRAEALAEGLRLKRGITVAGTHGKTTTTSLLASLMIHTLLDPTIVVGGVVKQINSNVKWGKGCWAVFEADESDGSFDRFSPEMAIITNVDNDHLEFYGSFENLTQAYLNFAHKVPFYGRLFYCADDPILNSIFHDFPKRTTTYGLTSQADYQLIPQGDWIYEVVYRKNKVSKDLRDGNLISNPGDKNVKNYKMGRFKTPVPGDYNALNALAAIVVGIEGLGLSFQKAVEGVESFEGVGRRFQVSSDSERNIMFIDDYAHHPTEIQNVLKAAQQTYPSQRLVAIFQPHRYSRMQTCWDQFLKSFSLCDQLFLTDVYSAGEEPIEGYSSEILCEKLRENNEDFHVKWVSGKMEELKEKIQPELKKGDVVVVMGAGDISQLTSFFFQE